MATAKDTSPIAATAAELEFLLAWRASDQQGRAWMDRALRAAELGLLPSVSQGMAPADAIALVNALELPA